jgi:hypothetical protein
MAGVRNGATGKALPAFVFTRALWQYRRPDFSLQEAGKDNNANMTKEG